MTLIPIRVPASAAECKDDGYQAFPALGFKSQGDCVAYVSRTTPGGSSPGWPEHEVNAF